MSQFVNGRGGTGGAGLVLFDLTKKTFTKITVKSEPRKDWGDPACPGAPGEALIPHGISLSKRADASRTLQLYVVNHGGRQSMEMFESQARGAEWELAWHGCFVSRSRTITMSRRWPMAALSQRIPRLSERRAITSNLLGGQATGYVVRWSADKGEVELPGTRIGYPNGVVVPLDERYMYVNAWTAREVHKYDLRAWQGGRRGQAGFHARQLHLDQRSSHHRGWRGGNTRRLSGR